MDTTKRRAVIFADHEHRTIFADKELRKILSIPQENLDDLIGQPVHKLLGISSETYNEIVKEPLKEAQSNLDNIELHDNRGNTVLVNLDYTVSKDAKGKLMGIDFTLFPSATTMISDDTGPIIPDDLIEQVIRFYFKRQIESLYAVITQVGGRGLWQYIETALNSSAEHNEWDIALNGQEVNVKRDRLSLDIYQGLLFKAAAYASNAIGKKLVKKRLDKVDEQSNPVIFEYIQKDWFEHLA